MVSEVEGFSEHFRVETETWWEAWSGKESKGVVRWIWLKMRGRVDSDEGGRGWILDGLNEGEERETREGR